MKHTVVIVIPLLSAALAASCSLPKTGRQTNSAASPQTESNRSTTSPAPAVATGESHPDQTPIAEASDELHTPEKGSTERQAIMDALRGDQNVVFQVNYLKVHNGWCWVDTTPLDKQGRATAEGGPNLLHLENGKWKVMDLDKVPDDPNDPLGSEDASPTYIRNVMKTFPGVPKDIFPKPSK
jgi:hypothetical protein